MAARGALANAHSRLDAGLNQRKGLFSGLHEAPVSCVSWMPALRGGGLTLRGRSAPPCLDSVLWFARHTTGQTLSHVGRTGKLKNGADAPNTLWRRSWHASPTATSAATQSNPPADTHTRCPFANVFYRGNTGDISKVGHVLALSPCAHRALIRALIRVKAK